MNIQKCAILDIRLNVSDHLTDFVEKVDQALLQKCEKSAKIRKIIQNHQPRLTILIELLRANIK